MLRGLLIRQAFTVVDLALAITVLGLVMLVAMPKLFSSAAPPVSAMNEDLTVDPIEVRQVASLDNYLSISNNGLFGEAAKKSANTPPPAPPPEPESEEIEETTLPLTLFATVSRDPRDPKGTAVIMNGATRQTDTYLLDKAIVDQVTLHEIHPRWVILVNTADNNKKTILRMDDDANDQRIAQARGPVNIDPRAQVQAPSNRITVSRQEIYETLSQNPADLIATVNPEMYYENGRVTGITSNNLSKLPVAQKMGLRDGDVVQKVNGVTIDSEQKIIEIINKYQNSPTFQLSVLRNGRPVMLTYNLE